MSMTLAAYPQSYMYRYILSSDSLVYSCPHQFEDIPKLIETLPGKVSESRTGLSPDLKSSGRDLSTAVGMDSYIILQAWNATSLFPFSPPLQSKFIPFTKFLLLSFNSWVLRNISTTPSSRQGSPKHSFSSSIPFSPLDSIQVNKRRRQCRVTKGRVEVVKQKLLFYACRRFNLKLHGN